MFNLESSISAWRRQMLAAGIKSPATLDELENHLREDIGKQMQAGLPAPAAFEIAVRQLGQPRALQNELAKVATTKKWRRLKDVFFSFFGVRPPPPCALTLSAEKALELGSQEAIAFHHHFIGTEHVLLGLLDSETGAVPGILQKLGVDHRVVRHEIEKIVGPGPIQPVVMTPPYTPRAKKALGLAGREAKANRNNCVSPEHIFLGLLLEGGGVAALVLRNLGVDAVAARQETLKVLAVN